MGRDGGADEEIEAMVGEERRFVEFKKRVSDKEIVGNYRLDMYVPKREEFYIAKWFLWVFVVFLFKCFNFFCFIIVFLFFNNNFQYGPL